ncbi:MAG: DUF1800 domain-containing protein [Acidimicrobiales bacterium]
MGSGTSPQLVSHLYRRAGFGATPEQVAELARQSWPELVEGLLAGLHEVDKAGSKVRLPHLTTIPEANVPGYQWNGYEEFVNLVTWWLERMVVSDTPLREKLTFLLHCQFPTSWEKVGWASLMHAQNQIFRTIGAGRFDTLTQVVAKDPSMLIWLDTGTDVKADPNENFARELMERFTMGAGNYTEWDVRTSAEAFTGWELDYTSGEFYENVYDHDNGIKHFLGHTGRFTGEEIVEIVCNTPASHRWITARMWSWLAYPIEPNSSIVAEVAASYAKTLQIEDLIGAILMHPAFRSPAAIGGLVKQPVEYVVGTLRLLGMNTAATPSGDLFYTLSNFGQLLFAPPSVGGWGFNQYWLSTSNANNFLAFAGNMSAYADLTAIADLSGNPTAQVKKIREILGIETWSSRTYAALMKLGTSLKSDSGTWPAQQLMTMALVSPDYLLN